MGNFRLNYRFSGAPSGHSFGMIGRTAVHEEEPVVTERLFAFAVAERSSPRVFDYSLDNDGIEGLANLIRSEEVLAVVQGHRAQFEMASSVAVNIKGLTRSSKLIISEG